VVGVTAATACEVCGGRRWLRIDPDGDHSRAYIERCDSCTDYHRFDDMDAVVLAGVQTGYPTATDLESAHDTPYLVGADPDDDEDALLAHMH
jgi:hypothetical protein